MYAWTCVHGRFDRGRIIATFADGPLPRSHLVWMTTLQWFRKSTTDDDGNSTGREERERERTRKRSGTWSSPRELPLQGRKNSTKMATILEYRKSPCDPKATHDRTGGEPRIYRRRLPTTLHLAHTPNHVQARSAVPPPLASSLARRARRFRFAVGQHPLDGSDGLCVPRDR